MRITNGLEDPAAGSPIPSIEESADAYRAVSQVKAAVHTAIQYVEEVQNHLVRIDTAIRDAAEPEIGRSDTAKGQTIIDREVRAIEGLVDTVRYDGARLLDGSWAVTLADVKGKGVRVLKIGSLSAGSLGNARIGGFLCALKSESDELRTGEEVARALAIVRCSILQAAGIHECIVAFVRDAIDPLLSTLEVTMANLSSAENTFLDADFAVETGNVTRLDVLAQTTADQKKTALAKRFSYFR